MSVYPIDEKFAAFGWHVIRVDAHDFEQIAAAFAELPPTPDKPTVIISKSTKGKGVPFMENKASWHGVAPNKEQYISAMAGLKAQLAILEKTRAEQGGEQS
jgi:transketolase